MDWMDWMAFLIRVVVWEGLEVVVVYPAGIRGLEVVVAEGERDNW